MGIASYNELRWQVAVPLVAAPVLLFVMIYDLSIPQKASYTISIVCISILAFLALYLFYSEFSRYPYNLFR